MTAWKGMSLLLIIFLLLIVLLAGCGVPREEYEKVERDLGVAQMELSQKTSELTQRNSELTSLRNQYNDLQSSYEELYDEYDELLVEYTDTQLKYNDALEELGQSLQVPYTAISGREITWAFGLLDGSTQKWTLDVDTYRYWIERPEPTDTVTLSTDTGPVVMVDFTKYVYPETFEDVVTSLYERSDDEWEFAKEAFNIVAQLTVYSEDIGEDPRWPLETFTEGGGDCEDLAILYATLLKAAPYPYEVELVYMDADNPTDPEDVNHVIVKISTDDWAMFAECTSNQGWGYYERVVGWYYEL